MRTTENIKLIQKAKKRDPDAFTELINLYMKDMYRVAIAILMNDEDAADAIQETILTCWERIGSLRDNKLFKTWMPKEKEKAEMSSGRKQRNFFIQHY